MTPAVLQHYAGKTVVVTGASGYIGAALAEALAKTSAHLLLVSRRPPHAGQPAAPPDLLTADVRDRACWDDIAGCADIVFHLAGNTSVYAAAASPADSLRSTVLPLVHLIAAAREARRRLRVVHASTATVYGLTDRLPVSEEVAPNPVTVYDLHKWHAEQQLAQASEHGTLDGVSLRLANVYGPGAGGGTAADRGILNAAARRAVLASDLPLYGDGRYLRDYVYIDDVVAAFLMAGVQPGITGRAFNVASGHGVTVRDAFHLVAERAARVTGNRSRVPEVAWPDDADPIEFRNFVGDIRLMASTCGWAPQVSFATGVDRLIDSLIDAGRVHSEPPQTTGIDG